MTKLCDFEISLQVKSSVGGTKALSFACQNKNETCKTLNSCQRDYRQTKAEEEEKPMKTVTMYAEVVSRKQNVRLQRRNVIVDALESR